MKPVDQTTFGEPGGNCFSACVASLLELALEDVPYFMGHDHWFLVFQNWLRARGWYAVNCKLADDWQPAGLYILGGESPRGAHAVIAEGSTIVHDPHPSRTGLVARDSAILLVPLDPGRMVRDRRTKDALAKLDLAPCTATAHDAGTGQTLTCAMLTHGSDVDHVADGMRWRDGEAPRGVMGLGR